MTAIIHKKTSSPKHVKRKISPIIIPSQTIPLKRKQEILYSGPSIVWSRFNLEGGG